MTESFFTRAVRSFVRRLAALSVRGQRCGPHLTRYSMYRQIPLLGTQPAAGARVLSISHSTELCRRFGLGAAQIIEANYPECDVLRLPFEDRMVDYVVSDQVLEHVAGDPQAAIDECHRVLKPGGLMLQTTCLINPIHEAPGDFWRFTPDGLGRLCMRFSRVLACQGWGNPWAVAMIALDLRFQRIPEAPWHPLHKVATYNDPAWPIVTWVLAQR